MTKNLQEFIHRIRNKLPIWINFQNLIFLIVIFAFIVIVLWSEPLSHLFENKPSVDVVYTTTTTILPGTPTTLPDEWIRSDEQTSGVILGAIIIILAVVAGTAVILIRDRDR
ncbi:MAG: hypothetical protein J7K66_00480 [Anaerolineaceae bacterium]|nr:hypothetical protein [Anaerolineaceae bacterium]